MTLLCPNQFYLNTFIFWTADGQFLNDLFIYLIMRDTLGSSPNSRWGRFFWTFRKEGTQEWPFWLMHWQHVRAIGNSIWSPIYGPFPNLRRYIIYGNIYQTPNYKGLPVPFSFINSFHGCIYITAWWICWCDTMYTVKYNKIKFRP